MIDTIVMWYENWTMSVLHWYTSHPVLLATSLIGSAVLCVGVLIVGIVGAIKIYRSLPAEMK